MVLHILIRLKAYLISKVIPVEQQLLFMVW